MRPPEVGKLLLMSFRHSSLDMVDSSADKDDALCDAIAEVCGPLMKCQPGKFTGPLAVASVGVDPVVSLPRPSPPHHPLGIPPSPVPRPCFLMTVPPP